MTPADLAAAERLARLLDGRVTAEERAACLRELDADPALRAVYADAVAAMSALDAAPTRPVAGAIGGRRSAWRRFRWAAIAATLVAVVATPVVRYQRARNAPSMAIHELALSHELIRAADQGPERRARRGASSPTGDRAASVWLGVRLTDLELLGARGDSGASAVARELSGVVTSIPGGVVAIPALDAVAGALAPARQQAISEAVRTVGAIGTPEYLSAGRWLEVARLAAATADVRVLESGALRRGLRRAASLMWEAGDTRASLAAVQRELDARPIDPSRLQAAVVAALRTLDR